MAVQKFYAVAKGYNPGIYMSWDECKQQVDGYPGAIYRSFLSFDEADEYLEDNEVRENDISSIIDDSSLSISQLKQKYNNRNKAICFVDGSFYQEKNKYSYGGIIICNGNTYEFYDSGNDPELLPMRNVAGEILGATRAMQICLNNHISELNLFYDYEGIEKWCTLAWKANKIGTQNYRDFYQSIKNRLKVNFIKVKGHTGVELNERVDYLAKKALGIEN